MALDESYIDSVGFEIVYSIYFNEKCEIKLPINVKNNILEA